MTLNIRLSQRGHDDTLQLSTAHNDTPLLADDSVS
jgi:hypothetical protein